MPELQDNKDPLYHLQERTIRDFGKEWIEFHNIDYGYYGEDELFEDILRPFLLPSDMAGKLVADIGSGSGRIVNMLLAARPQRITAVEPSEAFGVLQKNTAESRALIDYRNCRGDQLNDIDYFDYIVSIGVIHHIPNPAPTLLACHRALKKGGRLIIWLYGKEGNGAYLFFVLPLRRLTANLPHQMQKLFAQALTPILRLYIGASRVLPLPMRKYMREVLAPLTPEQLTANIFDQLTPAYAKYYSRNETLEMLRATGFTNVVLEHRHGYSWTACATK